MYIRQWTAFLGSPLCVVDLSPTPLQMGEVLGDKDFKDGIVKVIICTHQAIVEV
ncbi:MAG: hypothetical protein J6S09_07730 [Paludibacteraceae bacterium]|nr:hypothetical protein [Paludibacteraceae bacterium]